MSSPGILVGAVPLLSAWAGPLPFSQRSSANIERSLAPRPPAPLANLPCYAIPCRSGLVPRKGRTAAPAISQVRSFGAAARHKASPTAITRAAQQLCLCGVHPRRGQHRQSCPLTPRLTPPIKKAANRQPPRCSARTISPSSKHHPSDTQSHGSQRSFSLSSSP